MAESTYSIQIVFSDEPRLKYLLAWELKEEEVAWIVEGMQSEIILAYFIGETFSDRSVVKFAWFRCDERNPAVPSNFRNVFNLSFRMEAFQFCSIKFGRSLPSGTFQSVLEKARNKYLKYLESAFYWIPELYGEGYVENFTKPHPIYGKKYDGPVSTGQGDFFRPLKPRR